VLLEEAQSGKEISINQAITDIDDFLALPTFTGDVTLTNGADLVLGTGSGTKIGTSATQKLGFFNATPIIQPVANEDIRASLIGLGLIAGGINPLNLNGGVLAAGAASFSGAVGGGTGGSAFTWKRFALTFPSDADYTLAVGERDAVTIDVQTGVITATRNIVVPGTANGHYWVINRNAQSVVLKTSGGTGITVPSARARLISFPGGVNGFSLTPSQDYTV
jgi:hypothetical protein